MNNIKTKIILIFFSLVLCVSQSNISFSSSLDNIFNSLTKKSEGFKVIQVSDVHFQEVGETKGKRQIGNSKPLLEQAISEINNIKNTDIVLFTGDMINCPKETELYKFLNVLKLLKINWYSVIGNHDVAVNGKLTKQKYMNILHSANTNIPNKSYYVVCPRPNWAIIALDGVKDNLISANGEFDKEELKWLDEQLTLNKNRHVLIFQHFPIIEPFKSATHKVLNDDEYLEVLSKHKNVIAVLAGHYHSTKTKKVNNIAFINTPSLVQFPNAYRILNFQELSDKIILTTEIKQVNYKTVIPITDKTCKDNASSCGSLNDRNTIIVIEK